ncbi:Pentatricopeptide repeat-containing protein [Nymphaea thermarum]|nr:Pentatricopeptide repeat-containing protein [Nymphaea thermarum]
MSGSLLSLWRSVALLSKSTNIAAPVVVHGFPLQNHLLEKLADCRCMDYARVAQSLMMLENCIKQSNFTFAMMVKACSHILAVEEASRSMPMYQNLGLIWIFRLGTHVFGERLERDLVSWNSIISVSVSVGEVELAHQLLNEIPMLRNVISWIAQVGGHGQPGRPAEMVHLFVQMLISADNINPNSAIMVSLVSASSDVCSYELSNYSFWSLSQMWHDPYCTEDVRFLARKKFGNLECND